MMNKSEIEILFENADFIVCIKPVGILSQRDASQKENMQDILGDAFCIHRLDREVSGVMVFAKNKNSADIFSRMIADGSFHKEYYAVVNGKPESEMGEYEDLLFKDSSKNKSFVVKRERKGVKKARLFYEIIASKNEKTLVKIALYTGRTHQIRVQFSSRKMPLCGDSKYGSDEKCDIALFSHRIYFSYKGKDYDFTANPNFEKYPWNIFDMKNGS